MEPKGEGCGTRSYGQVAISAQGTVTTIDAWSAEVACTPEPQRWSVVVGRSDPAEEGPFVPGSATVGAAAAPSFDGYFGFAGGPVTLVTASAPVRPSFTG